MNLLHPVVVLLGAGATRGALQKNRVPPPVDADFFEIAGQITGHGTLRLARSVLNDIRSLYRRIPGVGLENYYRDIETRARIGSFARSANRPKEWQAYKDDLEELIRRVIIHTTCRSEQGRLEPLRSRTHARILNKLEENDTILTFNYDVLIEHSFGKSSLWTPRDGYGGRVHGVRNEWCQRWLKAREINERTHSRIQLLKLHGSINWTVYKSGHVRLKDRPFVVRTREHKTVFEKVSILPPGWNKRIDKIPYSRLWRQARLRLEQCKSLVIIGYSLPEADLLAKALFAEVVRLRAARKHYLRQLHLADPNESVKERLVELFVPALNAQSKIFRYANIDEFSRA
jgi:hypothetical protein